MPSIPFRTNRIRMLIFLKRKPGITHDEFSKYWVETHGPLFASLNVTKKNILKYEQAHTNPISSVVAQGMRLTASDFDGTTFDSEEYAQKIVPDETEFIDRPKCQVLIQELYGLIDG